MTEPLDSDIQNGRLWREYLAEADLQLSDLTRMDPNVLAAYLDGSAQPSEIERIEAHLASDPLLFEELLALRQMTDMDATAAPASLLRRAKALGHRYSWRPRLSWAAAAAAVLLACFAGYRVGNTAQLAHRDAEIFASLQISLEIDELISEPAFGIILPLNGNNGR